MRQWSLFVGILLSFGTLSSQSPSVTSNESKDLSLIRAIVFKDGFAYTFREGEVTPTNGQVSLRTIPQAREGTLYAYIADGKGTIARLEFRQVEIDERKDKSERMFNDLYELLRNNEGKRVRLTTNKGETLEGVLRIVTPIHDDPSIPRDPQKPIRVAYIAIEGEVTALVRTDQIERVHFLEPATLKEVREYIVPITERRLAVVLDDADDGKPLKLGLAALEAGIRWDATYRLVLTDERPINEARVELVATIDNQLASLKDTVLLLAVGMPNFPYRMQIASLLAPPGERRVAFEAPTMQAARQPAFTQVGPVGGFGGIAEITPILPAETELPTLEAAQLVFYETTPLTLKREERASLVLFSQTLPCREVFEWSIGEVTISALRSNVVIAGMQPLSANFWYALALRNTLKVPLTTGIATAYQEWRPIGQGILPFTAVGEEAIIRLTPATEVVGDHEEKELSREPVMEQRETAGKRKETVQVGWWVTIEGTVKIRNTRQEKVTAIVRRTVEGEVIKASDNATVKVQPPARVADRNPITNIRWQLDLPQGEKTLTHTYRKFVAK